MLVLSPPQVGTDIDPLAVKSAAANARLNGMEQRLAAFQCQGVCVVCVCGGGTGGRDDMH